MQNKSKLINISSKQTSIGVTSVNMAYFQLENKLRNRITHTLYSIRIHWWNFINFTITRGNNAWWEDIFSYKMKNNNNCIIQCLKIMTLEGEGGDHSGSTCQSTYPKPRWNPDSDWSEFLLADFDSQSNYLFPPNVGIVFTLHTWSTAQESNTQIEDCLRFLANFWHVWCRPIGHLNKINGSNEKLEGFHGGHNHRSKHIKKQVSPFIYPVFSFL